MSRKPALTLRQRLFCSEYVRNGGNATQAAKDAGYSEATAYSQGSRLLKKVEAQRLIEQKAREAIDKVDWSRDDIVRRMARFGFAEVDIAALDPLDRARLASANLVNLAKLLGHWRERVEHEAGPTLLEMLEALHYGKDKD